MDVLLRQALAEHVHVQETQEPTAKALAEGLAELALSAHAGIRQQQFGHAVGQRLE